MLRVWLDGSRGLEQTARKLQRAQQELQDRSKPHKDIRTRMVWRWSVNFDSEGGMYGDWPELSEFTTKPEREALGYGRDGPKLKRTGVLRSGFIRQAEDGVVTRDATRWNFQRQPIYLYVQHFGGLASRYKARIPSRPIWGLNETDERMARDLMEEYVDSVIAKHF